jgi:hypothetical protein
VARMAGSIWMLCAVRRRSRADPSGDESEIHADEIPRNAPIRGGKRSMTQGDC